MRERRVPRFDQSSVRRHAAREDGRGADQRHIRRSRVAGSNVHHVSVSPASVVSDRERDGVRPLLVGEKLRLHALGTVRREPIAVRCGNRPVVLREVSTGSVRPAAIEKDRLADGHGLVETSLGERGRVVVDGSARSERYERRRDDEHCDYDRE